MDCALRKTLFEGLPTAVASNQMNLVTRIRELASDLLNANIPRILGIPNLANSHAAIVGRGDSDVLAGGSGKPHTSSTALLAARVQRR